MGISNRLPDGLDEVDIIIAGGGSAGCIVAARLASADPSLSILLIEGGTNNWNVPNVVHPALFGEHLLPASKTAIFYQGNQSLHLANRKPIVPAGGILGGGSSINVMLYSRAQRPDFDSWKTPGWSADEILPFLKKLETYHGHGKPEHHGFHGPIHISDAGFRVKNVEEDCLRAAQSLGYPEIQDLQNLDDTNGFERAYQYVSLDGRRQDAAHTFLHPLLQSGKHSNLHVLTEHKVVRVLFDDNKQASGVEFTPNPDYQIATPLSQHQKKSVKARKLVVLSSGACGSPLILERSGVGSKEVLDKAGVPLVEDLPGVGSSYQDHHLTFIPYLTSLEPHETSDSIMSGRVSIREALKTIPKQVGWNTIDVAGKLRPTEAEVAALGPEFKAAWDKDFRDQPGRPMMLMAFINAYIGDPTSVPVGQYMTFASYTAYPYSRGHIHITGPEISDPIDFDVGFFADEGEIDLKQHMWAYKKGREITRRTKFYRGEVPHGHPRYPEGSKAACVKLDAPLEGEIKDVEYSPEDDAAIEQHLREVVNTTWHSLGTNKMAPREKMGVVDKDLNVYGVKGLKIVDLSIPPENVAANTNNTALVIGEKGADIIARELGLSLPLSGELVYENN
ncbi:alcohol oxidase-like protein [Podospora didyma]|uniref:Alcohol oxidase-like protein n=1 Tax=Podospora didyma TaxID=330526 RepID=A0AAE0N4M2_9PEZI|nr:alcohol oxidase-like protein [Podospora didyma]